MSCLVDISKRRCTFRWIQGTRFALVFAYRIQVVKHQQRSFQSAQRKPRCISSQNLPFIISHPRVFLAPFISKMKCQGFSRTSGSNDPAVCNSFRQKLRRNSSSRSNDCNNSDRKDLKITTLLPVLLKLIAFCGDVTWVGGGEASINRALDNKVFSAKFSKYSGCRTSHYRNRKTRIASPK